MSRCWQFPPWDYLKQSESSLGSRTSRTKVGNPALAARREIELTSFYPTEYY
jgi:hypothetical protein